jgi:hypothetical protein
MRKHTLVVHDGANHVFVKEAEAITLFCHILNKYSYFVIDVRPKPGIRLGDGSKRTYLGRITTIPSYLEEYDKNEVYHECYYGTLRNYKYYASDELPDGIPHIDISRYGLDHYPLDQYVSPIVTEDGLFFSEEGYILYEHAFFGTHRYEVLKHPQKELYVARCDRFEREGVVHDVCTGKSIEELQKNVIASVKLERAYTFKYTRHVKNVSAWPYGKTEVLPPKINEFYPYYGDEFFSMGFNQGRDLALMDAVSKADGFHFSRLAAEIALDGLVIQTVQSLLSSAKRVSRVKGPLSQKLKACAKLLPSVYLGYNYGIAAPLRDYIKLPGALESQFSGESIGSLIGTSRTSWRGFDLRTRVSLNIGAFTDSRQIANFTWLTKGGLSLDDLWEVVPLSFVIDWFLNLSSLLEAGRLSQIYSELPVESLTMSTTFEQVVDPPPGYYGDVVHRYYCRQYLRGSSLPSAVYAFDAKDLSGTLSLRNIDEGIALILSYLV